MKFLCLSFTLLILTGCHLFLSTEINYPLPLPSASIYTSINIPSDDIYTQLPKGINYSYRSNTYSGIETLYKDVKEEDLNEKLFISSFNFSNQDVTTYGMLCVNNSIPLTHIFCMSEGYRFILDSENFNTPEKINRQLPKLNFIELNPEGVTLMRWRVLDQSEKLVVLSITQIKLEAFMKLTPQEQELWRPTH